MIVQEYEMKNKMKSDTWGIRWHGAGTRVIKFHGQAPCRGIPYEIQLEQKEECQKD